MALGIEQIMKDKLVILNYDYTTNKEFDRTISFYIFCGKQNRSKEIGKDRGGSVDYSI